jgi:N-acetylmuramoyl-L-alanine amidase
MTKSKDKLIILDNGHGITTPGKRSPDGNFREYKWCRDFVKLLKYELEEWGYNVALLVPEDDDISISARIVRANKLCDAYGVSNCILISIHNNAAGNGDKWYNVTGFEAYTSPGRTKSDTLAEFIYEEIEREGIKVRKDEADGDADKEATFSILSKTRCPAMLTENMFMDSERDVEFLNSDEGKDKLLKAHIIAIRRYFEDFSGTFDTWLSHNTNWTLYCNKRAKKYGNECI